MKFGRLGELKHGYNAMTTCESAMLMDIGYQVMNSQEKLTFKDDKKETAFVILTGEVVIHWENQTKIMKRDSLFDENPYCLHVPAGVEVIVQANRNAE
ncbi:MAG: 5-deoxyglucuronate isomerase, partial [Massilibacillus sp.]|nr:5-deoxyglucuronate isomerase [Massilibacillus sp.]